ncbi:MAG: TetR/AcrR family transcriptional regulator [Janthinobacterium lividum]
MIKNGKPTKRQVILEEAAKLFKDKGYVGTSMRDIAGQVGMEAASMYNHIKSKDEILDNICFRISDIYIAHLQEIEELPLTYGEKLRTLIRRHIQLMIEDGPEVSVANHDFKYLPAARLTDFTEARRRYEKGLAALIGAGTAAGEFQAVNPTVALFTILSAVRWIELWFKPGRSLSAQELEDNIITMLLNGLEKR